MTSKSAHDEANIIRSGLYENQIEPADALRLSARIKGEETAKRDIIFHILQNDASMEMLHMSLDVAATMKYPSPKFQVLSEILKKCPNNFEQSVIIDYKAMKQSETVDGASAEKSEIIETICGRENRMPMSLFNEMVHLSSTLYDSDCVPNAFAALSKRPECQMSHIQHFTDIVNGHVTDENRKSHLLKQITNAPICVQSRQNHLTRSAHEL